MRFVSADDGSLIFLAIVQRDFDLARVGNDMIVGENLSFFVDDEAGTLALLGHEAIEEIKGHDARGDVDDGCDVLAIDTDIILLFGVERFAAGGFDNFSMLRMADPVGSVKAGVAKGGEIEERGR